MGELSDEKRKALIEATREAGIALLEDLNHMREIIAHPTRRGDARYLSVCLRRLLVNREIQDVAAPRIGRFHINARDLQSVYRLARTTPILFFMSGGWVRYEDDQFQLANFCMLRGTHTSASAEALGHPGSRVQLNVDQFLNQRIMALDNEWVSRLDVIKYVSNVAGVAHTGSASDAKDHLIDRIRRSVRIPLKVKAGEDIGVQINLDAFNAEPLAYTPSMDHMDPLLLEFLSTTEVLCASKSTADLEHCLKEEFGY